MPSQLTVTELQKRIASIVDERYATPTVGGEEWELRLSLLNQAQDEWASAHEWESMRKYYYPNITVGATITLSADFSEFSDNPRLYGGSYSNGKEWPLIKPTEMNLHTSESEYGYKMGNPAEGYSIIWNPGTLASGSSIQIAYYAFPTSLASPTDITQVDTPDYLVKRAISMRWEIANDSRYQQMEARAREILLQAVENDNAQAEPIKDRVLTEMQEAGFRFGRD